MELLIYIWQFILSHEFSIHIGKNSGQSVYISAFAVEIR